MSRKHFKALAKAIKGITNDEERGKVAHIIGEVCAESNDRFQWSKFLSACNVVGD